MNKSESFLFIPDISGFTTFVQQTEISHSKHIIEELLEVIIKTNPLKLQLAEIEGDAVLFFQYQQTPSISGVFEMTREIFIAFHQHLKSYERNQICHCGACSTAVNLTLKFVAFIGELQLQQVQNHTKPYGPGVIIAHRLLKNDLHLKEYLLMAGSFNRLLEKSSIDFTREALQKITISIENLEPAQCVYLGLTYLRTNLPEPPPLPPVTASYLTESFTTTIMSGPGNIYEIISNLEYRALWSKTVKEVKFEPREMNRAGTRHVCIFDNQVLQFESMKEDYHDKYLVYAEKVINPPLMKELRLHYIIAPDNKGSQLTIQAQYRMKAWWGFLFTPYFSGNIRKSLSASATGIKDVAENMDVSHGL